MNSGPTLAIGSTGPDVRRLQRILVMMKVLAYAGLDGVFDPQTDLAVRSFQQGNGLTADGIVGDQTWWVPAGAAGATLASLAGLVTI